MGSINRSEQSSNVEIFRNRERRESCFFLGKVVMEGGLVIIYN